MPTYLPARAGRDRHAQQRLHRRVALVEGARDDRRNRGRGPASAASCRSSRSTCRRSNSRNCSASSALLGSSHIMITSRPSLPRSRPFSAEQFDHLRGFLQRAHERHHQLDVGQAHVVAHALQRVALQLEASPEGRLRSSATRRGNRASGSLRPARSWRPPIRLAYSLDLKSDRRTITGSGAKAAAIVAMPSAELARRSRAGRVAPPFAPRSRASASGGLVVQSSSARGWTPMIRLMMNSSRARPTPLFGSCGKVKGELGIADVHHDVDRGSGSCVELGLLALESSKPS